MLEETRSVIRRHPQDQYVPTGSTLTLSVEVQARLRESRLSYTWFANGRPIPDHEGPTLTIDGVTEEHVGLYWCLVVWHPSPGGKASRGGPVMEASSMAAVSVYGEGSILVTGVPYLGGGGARAAAGGCPGPAAGYVVFWGPNRQGWRPNPASERVLAADPDWRPEVSGSGGLVWIQSYDNGVPRQIDCKEKVLFIRDRSKVYIFVAWLPAPMPAAYSLRLVGFRRP
ncbi:MAG: immunoglobulin domain-containing protein [Thermodesulfobacteriota bacterium]